MSAASVALAPTPGHDPGRPGGTDVEEPAPAAASASWRRHWFAALAVVLLLASTVALVAARNGTSAIPLSPDNPGPAGAMAAARVLERQGVDVVLVRTTDDAAARATPGTTLLVAGTNVLSEDQLAALRGTGADLVLAQTAFAAGLGGLTEAIEPDPAGAREPVVARCADPHAAAAGEISASIGGVRALAEHVEVCFPTGAGTGAYAAWEQDGRSVRVLADGALLSNDDLPRAGNAALVLRVLGQHAEVVWYIPTPGDTVGTAEDTGASLLPPEVEIVGLQLGVLALAVILWRARRLGRVVTEAMPVVVRAAETTRGRGRLYRRSGDHAHAAAALRAGCAHRVARALGLPRSARATALLEAAARATGRGEDELSALLYGPPPADGAGLLALTRALDTLESEVHRP